VSVWFCIPSIRPPAEATACLDKWRGMGYKTAVLRQGEPVEADLVIPTGEYLGWPRSTNILCREVFLRDRQAFWCVGGGDDYFPDSSKTAEVLSREHTTYYSRRYEIPPFHPRTTFGVVQFTGDRWGDSESTRQTFGQDRGAEIDRICGSPWMGREWCERSYLGNGPMWDGYHHLYADEELCEVAKAQGVLWQRRDLTQYHNHPCRTEGYGAYAKGHLAPLYEKEAWNRERAIFEGRKAKGFPGSEPCPR
jgi:hypothetical protein